MDGMFDKIQISPCVFLQSIDESNSVRIPSPVGEGAELARRVRSSFNTSKFHITQQKREYPSILPFSYLDITLIITSPVSVVT